MKRKVIAGILSVLMAATLMTGCGGGAAQTEATTAPAAESAEAESAEVETVETETVESEAAEPAAEGAAEGVAAAEDSFAKTVSTFMAEHGRPVGDLIVDLGAPVPEELTEEEGAELDRAMRAYTPGVDSLLVNAAKNFYFYGKLSSEQKEIYDAIYMLAEDPTNIDNVAVVEVKTTLDNTYYQNTIEIGRASCRERV